jgi:hypothetical protein
MSEFYTERDLNRVRNREELEAQLAAERESRDGFRRALEQRISEVDDLREQLAAERERATSFQMELARQHTKAERLAEGIKHINALARGNMTGCGTCDTIIDVTIPLIP